MTPILKYYITLFFVVIFVWSHIFNILFMCWILLLWLLNIYIVKKKKKKNTTCRSSANETTLWLILKLVPSTFQWFPRARLPEPSAGGGGGGSTGRPVWAGGVPASPCVRVYLSGGRGCHRLILILLLSSNACHLPGFLLHPALWKLKLPFTWASWSPRSPGSAKGGSWWACGLCRGRRDRGDRQGR